MNKKSFPVLVCFFLVSFGSGAQVYIKPNYGIKSHETLEILRVEATPQNTVFYMSIENRITGGYFCTDKRTYIYLPGGSRSRMTKAEGIPYCPDLHKFYSVGEKLHFELVFSALPPEVKWVNLIEQCGGNCYWVYGIVLDNELNRKLDELFSAASEGKPEERITLFRRFLEEPGVRNHGIEGMIYFNLVNAALEAGDSAGASIWYRRLGQSGAPGKEEYLKLLNEKGIKF